MVSQGTKGAHIGSMTAAGGRHTLRSSSAVEMRVVSSRQRRVEDQQADLGTSARTRAVSAISQCTSNAKFGSDGNVENVFSMGLRCVAA